MRVLLVPPAPFRAKQGLWGCPPTSLLSLQNPNSPRRSKSLKHKNGEGRGFGGGEGPRELGGGWVSGRGCEEGGAVMGSVGALISHPPNFSGELSGNPDPFKVREACPLLSPPPAQDMARVTGGALTALPVPCSTATQQESATRRWARRSCGRC